MNEDQADELIKLMEAMLKALEAIGWKLNL
jgi:hypothetical protein